MTLAVTNGIICLMVGLVLGFVVARITGRRKPVGTLRVDHSDPTEAPYLFLELENGGMDTIQRSKTVYFKVNLQDYLPRK